MAYGRLDVFWPDGQFMTFPLVDNNISVGRSTGNTIVLDTSTISRYHLSIRYDQEQVFVTDLDSVNGTFVDGVKLETNQPRSLYGGEEIQIGHLRLIYHQIEETATQPIEAVEETTQRIELQLPDFRIDVISPDIPVSPGAHASAEIAITNTSQESQSYIVSISGIPAEWVRIDRPRLTIDPGEFSQVLINFRPLRRPDSKPGNYTVTVRVVQANHTEARLEAPFIVHILPYSGFGMALDAKRVQDGERFRLHLHNQGSAVLPLTITGHDPGDKLRFNILVPQVSLAPGQRLTVQGEVKSRSPILFGKSHQYPFDITARSNDAAHFVAAVRGQFIEKPRLPSWTMFALVGGGGSLLVVALFFVIMLLGRPAPPPRILNFSVSSTQVARGSVVDLAWSVADVRALNLKVNGTPVLTDDGRQTSGVPLDTDNLIGSVALELVGVSGDQQASATQDVYVYEPLGEGLLTVTPTELVRYVVQTLNISWDMPGAVVTRLSGLEAFGNAPVEPQYGAQGMITVSGIPAQPFTLTLYAEDEVGNTREQTLNFQVINPECTPASGDVTLYAGPDTRHQVIGTVPGGAAVVVDAQDGTGKWLRVQLPGGFFGWGQRTQFTCAAFFNPDALYKEANVPTLPPPSPTPTRTPRPTLTPASTAAG
ncbi:MAG TPA: FHA domain-containing protein [Phototrophicaceae bacterium]|nr:FHA domain-containing protein [Phototrophicaceae bacterium]